ncbi:uncharacterized protein LOC143063058 [Mytilus galloprovincialis]|uniref:uncharacterized protein LOC143063058 n=1 Tax=Mytilus galloprovincialis TaxID=29158 RepID=UPI003F7BF84E
MPKLKKRRNVPSQRKVPKKPKQSSANSSFNLDHSYTSHDHVDLTTACLEEEIEIGLINSAEIEDIEPKQSSVNSSFNLDHSYTSHDHVDLTTACFEEEMEIGLVNPAEIEDIEPIQTQLDHVDVEDIQLEESLYSDPVSSTMPYEDLKSNLQKYLSTSYTLDQNSDYIQIMQLYPPTGTASVKLNVTIDQKFAAKVFVHRIELCSDHQLWKDLPTTFDSIINIQSLLSKLESFSVCVGNYENDLIDVIPIGSAVQHAKPASTNCHGYREGDFGAVKGTISYSSTVRNVQCALLVQGHRCYQCSQLRRILVGRKYRQEEKQRKTQETSGPTDYLHSKMQHSNMSKLQLIEKIHQQKDKITDLQNEILRTKNQFQREMASKGVTLDFSQSLEIKDTMATCNAEMEKACPDENSYQRLFWTEQMKCMNLQSTKGMRWHPMILRWCLYLRQKSSSAYDALRDSGFITLPSSRTLFDYSHYTRSDNGFLPDVIKVLKEEATKRDMYSTEDVWKNYVGILFNEIKIKSDLVYDKHTGELIGYCNLDKVGNQIMDMERSFKDSPSNDIAKYMLVLMVRGVATDLKFPLAGFATLSITADFLYPIIWKAIRILETSAAQLKVLFLTCDGASANRKFFNLHGQVNDFVYFTDNPFSEDGRKIYFVSDVPHLIKTTRNCYSNSFSHLNTRKLWNNGKDISWIHLLTMFEQHCEMSLYTPCPKLTRSHLDLTPFGRMKVNLAAQVLSSTVANALEMMYGDNVSETVNFLRIIDKFFDCLNVRNLYEGRNKRNPNLNPYTNINDERLQWLTGDFLSYFDLWEQSVMQRPGEFTNKQRKGMLLSRQTLTGLKISVLSIVACVKFLLEIGAKFVLTHNFNQDPLEQHFGHYRHRAGDNSNPTVYDVRHMMTTMRAVGAQALAPRHSNINNKENRNMVIDNSKLPKRGNYF